MIGNLYHSYQEKSSRAFAISNFQYPSDIKKFIKDWMQNFVPLFQDYSKITDAFLSNYCSIMSSMYEMS